MDKKQVIAYIPLYGDCFLTQKKLKTKQNMEIVLEKKDCELLERAINEPGFKLNSVANFLQNNREKESFPILNLPREEVVNLSQALAFIPKGEGEKLSIKIRKTLFEKRHWSVYMPTRESGISWFFFLILYR